MLKRAWRALRRGGHRYSELAGDRRWGIRTSIPQIDQSRHDMAAEKVVYDPVPYRAFATLEREVPVSASDIVYDIGCGMGRVVCFYASKPIRRAVGVEYDEGLCKIARANIANLKGRRAPSEIIEDDATAVDFRDATVAFMFNPFGADTMARVIGNLTKARTNPLRIVYMNPVQEAVIQACPALIELKRFKVSYDLAYAPVVVWSIKTAKQNG